MIQLAAAASPLVDKETLLFVDFVVQAAGVILALACAAYYVRRRGLADPLADVPHTGNGPGALQVAGITFGYMLAISLLAAALPAASAAAPPGSSDWHLRSSATGFIGVLFAILISLVLRAFPIFPQTSPPLGAARFVRVAFVAALAIMPICLAQAQFSTLVWHVFDPQARPPEHDVLGALQHSAWGGWGTLQLFVLALVVAPLSEELFFRGLLLDTFWRLTGLAWLSIVMVAAGFAYVHLVQPQALLPMFSLGLLLGYLRLRYRSVWLCIVVHAIFNSRAMILATLNPEVAT